MAVSSVGYALVLGLAAAKDVDVFTIEAAVVDLPAAQGDITAALAVGLDVTVGRLPYGLAEHCVRSNESVGPMSSLQTHDHSHADA